MNIDIHQPELKAMIQQRMATGRFRDVEDVLLHALRLSGNAETSLVDVLEKARVLLEGEELDITRDPSPGRSVDFS